MPETCHACGEAAVTEVVVPFTVSRPRGSRTFQDSRMACSACGNVSYRGGQVSAHERAVADAAREIDGLLSPDALRAFRERYALRQSDMEAILGTGPKTWTRWERGKVVHGRAVDRFVRALARDPYLARREMHEAGVVNPDAEVAFDRLENEGRDLSWALREADPLGLRVRLGPGALGASEAGMTLGEALAAAGFGGEGLPRSVRPRGRPPKRGILRGRVPASPVTPEPGAA